MNLENIVKKSPWLKLLIIPLVLIVVAYKAEFNYSTNSELYFKILKIAYILTISGLFLFVIFFYKRIKSNRHYSLLLFFITFLYYCYWIPYGLDITDTGYSLSNSWFISSGASFDVKGTFLLIGFWQHLIGTPSVLWCRIGYAIVLSSIALFSFKIINIYNPNNKFFIFLAVVVVSLLPVTSTSFTINYNTLPLIIVLIGIFFFSKAIMDNIKSYFIISGMFIALSIFSRIPYLVYGILPLLLLLNSCRFNKDFKLLKRNLFLTYLGILLGILTVILVLVLTKLFDNYVDLIPTSRTFSFFINDKIQQVSHSDITHSKAYLFELYKKDIWSILKIGFVQFLIFFIPVFVNVNRVFRVILIVAFACLFYYYSMNVLISFWYYSLLAVNIAIFILIRILNKKFIFETSALLLISFIVAMFSFLGSNNGFQNIIHSGGIVLILSALLVLLFQSKFKFKTTEYNFKIVYYILLIGIAYFAYNKRERFLYRDSNREKLTGMFETPALWGIYSSPERVIVVDELVHAIDSLGIKDNEYVLVNKPHLFSYITDKQPASMSWNTYYSEFKNRFDSNDITKYIILSLKNPRTKKWPKTKSLYSKHEGENVEKFKKHIDEFYKPVYKNEMFAIYQYEIVKDGSNEGRVELP
jgi:hypothetical protein